MLALCAVLLIVQGVRAARRRAVVRARRVDAVAAAQLVAFAVTVGSACCCTSLAAERLGFIVTGIVMLAALMLALRVRRARADRGRGGRHAR